MLRHISPRQIGSSSLGIYQSKHIHGYDDYLFAFPEHQPRTLDVKKIGFLESATFSFEVERIPLDPNYSLNHLSIERGTCKVFCKAEMPLNDIMALNSLLDQKRIFGSESQTIIFQFGAYITHLLFLYNGFISDLSWSGNRRTAKIFLEFFGHSFEQVSVKPLTKENRFDIEISDEKVFLGAETDIMI